MAAARFSDEDIRFMAEEGVDRPLEESLKTWLSMVTRELEDTEFPLLAQLDAVDGGEAFDVEIAEYLAEDAENYRHGAAVFAGRPGEEALVAALRDQAAWSDARLAEAEELAASTPRLRDKYLRTVAGTEELVHHATTEFLSFVSKETDGGEVPNAVDAPDAARAEAVDAAARAGGGIGARFAERFVTLAERLRLAEAATSYAGEEALVEAMQRQAASVEALCADADAFVAKMLATGSWRAWRIINRHVLAKDEARRRQLQRLTISN